jgi:hypothetical protein
VRHLMGHTPGLSGWEQPIAAEQLADWELCTSALAAQVPWWEPGSASGYHAADPGLPDRRGRAPHHREIRSAPGSPRRWPSHWVPTSSSGCPRARTGGSPT